MDIHAADMDARAEKKLSVNYFVMGTASFHVRSKWPQRVCWWGPPGASFSGLCDNFGFPAKLKSKKGQRSADGYRYAARLSGLLSCAAQSQTARRAGIAGCCTATVPGWLRKLKEVRQCLGGFLGRAATRAGDRALREEPVEAMVLLVK